MSKIIEPKENGEVKGKNSPDDPAKNPSETGIVEDQTKRGYYYDDAYGYEKYDPEKESDNE